MAEKRIELIERLQSVAAGSLDNAVVQSDDQYGSYGPDLVGLSADQVAYIQAFSPTLGSGRSVSYLQIIIINKETGSAGMRPRRSR